MLAYTAAVSGVNFVNLSRITISMEFTLLYQGSLRSNGGPAHKQELRRAFHPQLQRLWQLEPLKSNRAYVAYPPIAPTACDPQLSLLQSVRNFTFAPLISERLYLAAQLSITLLRPERPGQIIKQMGDIDNRLKTLFDALCVPPHPNQIPKGDAPSSDEMPFFCLLQDDCLVTKVSVDTQRLLTVDDTVSKSHVVILVHVKTQVTKPVVAALEFL